MDKWADKRGVLLLIIFLVFTGCSDSEKNKIRQVRLRKSGTAVLWAERLSNRDFDMTPDSVFNWGDPVIKVHRTYMSDNIRKGVPWSNTQNYRNPEVDALLTAAATALDPGKRKLLYNEFRNILMEEVLIIWISVLPFHTIYNRKLQILPIFIWGLFSPMDTINWKENTDSPVVSTQKITTTREGSLIKTIGEKAITLILEKGLFISLEILNDSERGFLDSAVNGTMVRIESVWPNPETDDVGMYTVWCGMLGKDDIICTLSRTDMKDKLQ